MKQSVITFRYIVDSLYANRSRRIIADVCLFAALLFSFHYIYIAWGHYNFWPAGEEVRLFFNWASALLFKQSDWVLQLMGINYYTEGQTFYITAHDGTPAWLQVAPGCTALKQWMHWIFLMLLFPGPWKHKAWYIPAGVLMIQLISVVRITGLAVALTFEPGRFEFYHNYIFKTMFYAGIFLMWLLWEEKIRSVQR